MALTTISPETQQKLAIFVPIIALGVSLFVVYPAWGRYSNLNVQIEKGRKELADLKATPPPPRLDVGNPTANDTVSEPSEFLGLLKRLAANSGCELTSADVSPKEGKASDGSARPVQARLEVTGQYRQIRSFLWQVNHGQRLLAVTEITIGPAGSDVKATITLERYVATPAT